MHKPYYQAIITLKKQNAKVEAMDTYITKFSHNVWMVPPSVPLIPLNITIKITCDDYLSYMVSIP